jgi:hypothetical protein
MKEGFEFVEFDFDIVWSAMSRSTQLRSYMKNLASKVEAQATALGRSEAYDEGYYADLFTSSVAAASQVRREFTDTYNARRNRSRRGGKNRIIDRPTIPGEDGKPVKIKGDPDGSEYGGAVGIVANTDFKAVWVEYGSIAKGPRFIMSRASETIAAQNDAEWEPIYAKTHQQNLSALSEKISQGMIQKGNGGRNGGKK